MKKLLLTAAVLAIATAPASANTGLYAGVGAGLTNAESKYSDSLGAKVNQSLSGFEGGIFAGYRHMLNKTFGLGVEAGFDFLGSQDDTLTDGVDSLSLEKKHSWYVAVQPVVALSETTAAFASVGYQRAKFDATVNYSGITASADESFNGLRLGVGVEHDVASNIGVRLEANYVNYGEKTETVGVDSYGFNPSEASARVGIAYKF
jgi:outer membrane immunogenic protein